MCSRSVGPTISAIAAALGPRHSPQSVATRRAARRGRGARRGRCPARSRAPAGRRGRAASATGPMSVALTWAGMSSAPSSVCSHGKFSGTAASSHARMSRAHVRRGVLVERQRRRRVLDQQVQRPTRSSPISGSAPSTSRGDEVEAALRAARAQLTLDPHRAAIVPRAGRRGGRPSERPRRRAARAGARPWPASRRRARRGATGRRRRARESTLPVKRGAPGEMSP